MREWNLPSAGPLSLFLAADARFCAPDYTDDQVWELHLRGGDPPALAAETMLGLRAVCLRIFPIFIVGSRPIHDPSDFAAPPVVRRFAPNYLDIGCLPAKGLEARCEYWVPESHVLAGKITLTPSGPMNGECWLAGVLRPATQGSPFSLESAGPYEGVYLRGQVRNSAPLLLVTGASGAGRGGLPSLKVEFEADASRPFSMRWAFCCHPTAEESLRTGKALLAREWEAEIARVELADESLVKIETGREDWDAVLAFSQQTAIQSLIGATRALPHPSPVVGRNPERGFSLRGDGSDYAPAWSGADLAELLMILPVVALAQPELAKDLLRNYLSFAAGGLPDARPGAGKQRSGVLAPPLLAQAAGRALGGRDDPLFLEELWPLIDRYLDAWFGPEHDRDQDGAPEWDRADSFGPEIPPMMMREDPWGGWIRPEEVESPSLAALLHGECQAAARIAEKIGSGERAQHWKKRGEEVRRGLDRMEMQDRYRTIDRVTHASPSGMLLWDASDGEQKDFPVSLKEPTRCLLRCAGARETRPIVRIVLRGKDGQGAKVEEEFRSETFSWLRGAGCCFSRTVWTRVDAIQTEGFSAGMSFRLEIPDLIREDLSDYLPLWSRSVSASRADRLFGRLAAGKAFDSPSGLRFIPQTDPAAGRESAGGVWMVWNMLMGEAAIRYGKETLVLEWIEKWMRTLSASLRTDRSFRSRYDPERAGGAGPRNSVHGIFPISVFLAALGVHPIAATRVWVGGRSIFPFPVILRYKGMIMTRMEDSLDVEFPSGTKRRIRGSERRLMEDGREE